MFNSARLALARKRRGLTKTALAEESGIALRTLIAYEAGDRAPTEINMAKLAEVLRFPKEFFLGVDHADGPPLAAASFRSLSSMSAGDRDSSLAAGDLALRLNAWIEERFDLPRIDLPDLRGHDPEAAAQMLRVDWALGEKPIRNVVHLLESRGVRVYSLPIDSLRVDAFSIWHRGVPLMFLNCKKSGEHGRFDASHELAHLVLHRHDGPRGRDAEIEANRFASAFLMPEASVIAAAPRVGTLRALIRLKKTWGVSVAALAYRLRALGLLSEWVYRQLCIEIARLGYHRAEPDGIPRETSQVLSKVLAALRAEGITRTRIAKDLHIQTEDLDSLTFGLVNLSPIQGGLPAGSRRSGIDRPKLRRVR